MSEKRKRRNYSKEFKVEAVKLAESIGVMKASNELGVAKKSIQNWMNGISMKDTQVKSNRPTTADLETELKRAKKEIKNLKLINEVLKKSTAIFSKDQIGDSW